MEKYKAENGVVFLRSELLRGIRHGFSTRLGGVSTLPHTASMNLAFGRGDGGNIVLHNLEMFCSALDIAPETTVSLPQVHSDDVIYVNDTMRGTGYYSDSQKSCDGYVTDFPNIALGVKIADCVPILLADREAGVIAAIHAGWRGTAMEIAARGIDMMLSLGARRENIYAAIGPAIGACCFEIGEEVAAQLCGVSASGHIKPSPANDGKCFADLPGMNKSALKLSGIPDKNIDTCNLCTCCNSQLFHSHRKTDGKRGTMLALISL